MKRYNWLRLEQGEGLVSVTYNFVRLLKKKHGKIHCMCFVWDQVGQTKSMQHVYPLDSAATHTSSPASLHKMYTVDLRGRHKREREGVLLFLSRHSRRTSRVLRLPLRRSKKRPSTSEGRKEIINLRLATPLSPLHSQSTPGTHLTSC